MCVFLFAAMVRASQMEIVIVSPSGLRLGVALNHA
jgi:hypothetical protein